jgi:dynein heavy chain, axonemal
MQAVTWIKEKEKKR